MLDPNVYTRTRDGLVLKVGVYLDNLLCSHPPGEKGRAQCAEFQNYGKKSHSKYGARPKHMIMGLEIEHGRSKGTLFLSCTAV